MFSGSMVHGKRQGTGTYTWTNGAKYEGMYVDNKKEGAGVMKFPDGSSYEGRASGSMRLFVFLVERFEVMR